MATHRKAPARRRKATPHAAPTPSTPSLQPLTGKPAGAPIFADPRPTPDPTSYTVPHASDTAAYKEMDALIKASKFLPLPFPAGPAAEPVLALSDAPGWAGASNPESICLA